MNKISFKQGDCKDETTSIWLAAVLQFAEKLDILESFKNFKLKMKKKEYSVYQKLMTLISSIVIGCECMKDLNVKLPHEKLSANMLGMEHFPDQSQINRLLIRMDDNSISQLEKIHHDIFLQNSLSVNSDDEVVIDIDQSGLIANGKTYEIAEKGYFPHKKNQAGYQLSAAFNGNNSETVAMYLDSGNTHCSKRSDDLIKSVLSKYREHLNNGKLIIRGDSGYGSSDNIEKLSAIPNLKFIVKGYSTIKASNLAKNIKFEDYTQADEAVWVYELPSEGKLRTIIVQVLTDKGKLVYTTLITNISKSRMSATELFHYYNKRQTIEAFFKTAKNVYHIRSLRTREFYGIYSFLWLVFITHNIITWFRSTTLGDTELKTTSIKTLVKEAGTIRAAVTKKGNLFEVLIPPITKLAKQIIVALCEPKYVQLSFIDT
jgi:hypothetical protein